MSSISATGDGRLTGEYFFHSGVTVFSGSTVITANASQSTVFTYNNVGQISTTTDDSGVTTNAYDPAGNLIQQITPEGTINTDHS
jgi:YD repeat-containing protein